MLPGCDRALELAGPGEGQPRLCAAHTRETQQQGPARRPSIDEASPARPGGSFTAPKNPNGSSRSEGAILAHSHSHSHSREKTEATAGHDVPPVKEETMMLSSSGSPGSNGGATTPGRLERMTEPFGQLELGAITTLDYRVPPRSPEAALGNGGTSVPATSPSPTAAWRMASFGGRGSGGGGGGGGSMEVLGHDKQAPAAHAHAAAPPPHVYQALRRVGGAAGDPAAAAAAVLSGGMSRRSSTPSTPMSTAAADGGVVRRGPGRDDTAIPMGGERKGRAAGSSSFGSAFPGYSNTRASGAHQHLG